MRGDALATARLADEAQCFAGLNTQRDAVDGAHHPVVGEEMRAQVLDFQHVQTIEYGSVASRRPSPRKLKASTALAMNTTGMSSHGKCANVWMFCASCSNVPQLTNGGRMPIPRKVSAVSARIMPGTASVETTMMWPETAGIRCWKTMRASPAPA